MESLREIIRSHVEEAAKRHEDHAVAISSGIDGTSVALTLLELGYEPTVYSFALEGLETPDVLVAERNAERMGLPFERVDIPTDSDKIIKMVRWVVDYTGDTRKANVECLIPRMIMLSKVVEDAMFNGDMADGWFGLSRSATIALRDAGAEEMDAFRETYFRNPLGFPGDARTVGMERYGLEVVVPYSDERLFDFFKGTTWHQVNHPEQKRPIREAWKEDIKRYGLEVRRHQPFQTGENKIAAHFERVLVGSPLNVGGWRSAKGIYNAMARGEV